MACGETLVWKLDGLSEYAHRRPLTPTGTNLLWSREAQHRDAPRVLRRGVRALHRRGRGGSRADAGPAAEFWATPDESREDIVDGYRDAWDFSDATIGDLALDAVGQVWWWGDAPVTLQHILVDVTAETQRHAGHADIVRELIDGSVGLLDGADSLHLHGSVERQRFCDQVEVLARRRSGDSLASERLGHSSVSITADVYQHVPEHVHDAASEGRRGDARARLTRFRLQSVSRSAGTRRRPGIPGRL